MEVWIEKSIYTLTALFAFAIVIYVLRGIVRAKLKRLMGYQKLANIIYGVTFLVFCLVLLSIWGLLSELISFAAALGIIGVMFGFAIIHVWLANAIAGVSLIFDKLVQVGCKIKINGTTGEVVEISLTSTKMVTNDGKLMVIPNKSFRDRPYVIIKSPQSQKLKARR